MRRGHFAFAVLAALMMTTSVLATPTSVAEKSKEARLLDILLERGIISQDEHLELSGLDLEDESPIRRSDVELKVEDVLARGYTGDDSEHSGYDHGFGVTSGDGLFSLKANGRVQARYTYLNYDGLRNGIIYPLMMDNSSFSLPRVRMSFSGHAFDPNVHYMINMDVADSTSSVVKDAWIEWRNDDYQYAVRAGQFKVPFGRQQLTSSSNLQFVDRASASSYFGFGRDVGAMFHGDLEGGFGYAVGLFNGEGEDAFVNDNNEHLVAGRLHFNPLGDFRLYEGDVNQSDEIELSIGVNGAYNPLGMSTGASFFGVSTEADTTSFGADAQVRIQGLSVQGEVFARETEADEPTGVAPLQEIEETGGYVQAGYFVIPEHLEVVGRVSTMTIEDKNIGIDDDMDEFTVGLNYYFHAHWHKLQLDFTRMTFDPRVGRELDDDVIRLQWQLKF